MPTCYLLAVAKGSSLDTYSNNWTLFHLVEQVQVSQTPNALPFEIHTYWLFQPDEYNEEFEFRFVLLPLLGDRVEGRPFPLRSTTPRYRLRATGLPLPGFGDYTLQVEWRRPGQESWELGHIFWPLRVEPLPAEESSST